MSSQCLSNAKLEGNSGGMSSVSSAIEESRTFFTPESKIYGITIIDK